MNIVVVVQARISSSRLPGKVLLPLLGKSVLIRQIERIKAASEIDQIVVATTTELEDDLIAQSCELEGIPVYRGSVDDCLDRHYRCGLKFKADVVVKIPSDCPLIDPAVIDRIVHFYRLNARKYDYVSNLHPATYPDGQDVEVIPMNILETAWKNARKPYEREHTTPYIWDNPEEFATATVRWESGLDYSMTHRWTLDYESDYHFIVSVFNELYNADHVFSITDILNLLARKPYISQLNSIYAGVNWYRHHLHELKTVDENMTRVLIG